MSDSIILSELIKTTALVPIKNNNANYSVELIESNEQTSKANILNLPTDALTIKCDEFFCNDRIFNGYKGECKRADFIIISCLKKCIVFIELKKNNSNFMHMCKQLNGAQCFIRYCQDIGKSFWKEKNFLNNYKHRFVCITRTSIDKRKTLFVKKANINNTPEKALKINYPKNLHFKQLTGII
jgi:hypothetical protein